MTSRSQSSSSTSSGSLCRVTGLAELAAPRGVHLIFSHQARFNDPLVEAGRSRLADFAFTPEMIEVAERVVAECQGPALYFPTPMERALESGSSWERTVERFHYTMIKVDQEQAWTWRGESVAARTKAFFLEHMFYEREIARWAFEYRVNENWWDKCYLDAAVSPFLATRLEVLEEGTDALVLARLASGQRARVDLATLRLDQRERLLVDTDKYGEVLVAGAERFRILSGANEALDKVHYAGSAWPLRWAETD